MLLDVAPVYVYHDRCQDCSNLGSHPTFIAGRGGIYNISDPWDLHFAGRVRRSGRSIVGSSKRRFLEFHEFPNEDLMNEISSERRSAASKHLARCGLNSMTVWILQ